MRSVEVHLASFDFDALSEMRTWLDRNRIQPLRFGHEHDKFRHQYMVRVMFETDAEAEAFRGEFGKVRRLEQPE